MAEAMTEECELRANIREVLEAVLERIGDLQRKADLLKVEVEFLRKKISEEKKDSAENEKSWKRKKKKINREYEQAYRRSSTRKKKNKREQPEKKKSRLKKIWKKLVKLFHPDRHMKDAKEKEAYEELTKIVNQAKNDGDLEKLEEIAKNPGKFLAEVREQHAKSDSVETSDGKSPRGKNGFMEEEKELQKTLDSILKELFLIRKTIRNLRRSQEIVLWVMWKKEPIEFEHAMWEMERELKSQIKTLEKVIEKMDEKLSEKEKEKWAA